METPRATLEFKRRLREAFDAMYVGQTFAFRRTFTDGDVALFCGVPGDYNPYHQDETRRRITASAGFVNQDGVEVLQASFDGFPGQIRLYR